MLAAFLLMASASQSDFVLVDRLDPITQNRQLALVTSADRNLLSVGCSSVGDGELFVRFVPDQYYGPAPNGFLWEPHLVYRFGNGKADKDRWTFSSNYIELGDILGANTAKAQFLDRLVRNNVLYIRYEDHEDDSHTVSFLYSVSPEQLSYVVKTCDPRRVQEVLRKMGSSIQTNPK